MSNSSITSRELVLDILPRLGDAEKNIATRLGATVQFAHDPGQKRKYQEIKSAFELEIMMIRLNLNPVIERHPDIRDIVARGVDPDNDYLIELSKDEAMAVDRARNLLARIMRVAG